MGKERFYMRFGDAGCWEEKSGKFQKPSENNPK